MSNLNQIFSQASQELARKNPKVWLETYAKIVLKTGGLATPKLNIFQRRMIDAYSYCHDNGLPCRIVALKPRQVGSSTASVGLLYHAVVSAMHRDITARVMGGIYRHTDNLYNILRTYAANDSLTWPSGGLEVGERKASVINGRSSVQKETARDAAAGRSATLQFLLVTEAAHFKQNGMAAADKVLSGIMSCVPKGALGEGTTIILESTANGASGYFFERYNKAVTLDQFRAGERGSGFIKIFSGAYEHPEYSLDLTDDEEAALLEDVTEEEAVDQAKYNLTAGQIAWRRQIVIDEFNGDRELSFQEFPNSEEDAFILSGRPRFCRIGLGKLQLAAANKKPDCGSILVSPGGKVGWQQCDRRQAVVHRWEVPIPGRRYLVAVDTMTGSSQAMGLDPDLHAAHVLRQGFHDADSGYWVPPAVIMTLAPPSNDYRDGARWDIDVLEGVIYGMAAYYGNCLIVPEMNMEGGLIEHLKLRVVNGYRPANIYTRQVFNQRTQKKTEALGWQTTTATRPKIIEAVATAIRTVGEAGGGISLNCPHLIRECGNTITLESGRCEAATGYHDDTVMALGIGLVTLELATRYTEPMTERPLPPEVRRFERRNRKQHGVKTEFS